MTAINAGGRRRRSSPPGKEMQMSNKLVMEIKPPVTSSPPLLLSVFVTGERLDGAYICPECKGTRDILVLDVEDGFVVFYSCPCGHAWIGGV